MHLSTRLPGNFWVVEVRRPGPVASLPCRDARAGSTFELAASGRVTLLAPYPLAGALDAPSRLWIAALQLAEPVLPYLRTVRQPDSLQLRHSGVAGTRCIRRSSPPNRAARRCHPPARPFTAELVTRLVSNGVQIAPLLLHTGVASLEDHEPPVRGVLPRAAGDRRSRQRGPKRAAIASSRSARPSSARSKPSRTAGADISGRRMDQSGDHAGATAARGERHDHRPARTARDASRDGRAGIAAAGGTAPSLASRTRLPRGAGGGYLWHEFGDSHLIIGA